MFLIYLKNNLNYNENNSKNDLFLTIDSNIDFLFKNSSYNKIIEQSKLVFRLYDDEAKQLFKNNINLKYNIISKIKYKIFNMFKNVVDIYYLSPRTLFLAIKFFEILYSKTNLTNQKYLKLSYSIIFLSSKMESNKSINSTEIIKEISKNIINSQQLIRMELYLLKLFDFR